MYKSTAMKTGKALNDSPYLPPTHLVENVLNKIIDQKR
jgi:hypothetical protein